MKHLNGLLQLTLIFVFTGCKKEMIGAPVLLFAKSAEMQLTTEVSRHSYKLVWADEFDYNGLPDSAYWQYEKGYARNNEAQYYVAGKLANSNVSNGVLTITALYDKTKKHPITSASITTLNKVNLKYGRVEVRAKMPVGAGTWPAIWMAGTNRSEVHWPACGEIDIMEWLGRAPQFVTGSIYTISASGKETSRKTPYFVFNYQSLSSHFHTYAIEWDNTGIRYYYDQTMYANYRANQLTKQEWEPFTKPFYLLLNLAMGGTSGGDINYTKFPFIYQIDYVRYYTMK